jgi:hypothetical protein
MFTARDDTGNAVIATPGAVAYCPLCHEQVRPKCGQIVTWHFAHLNREDCDPWSEGETQWHLDWKARFLPDHCEVPLGEHRADVLAADWVIEFQHSAISPDEILERQEFYLRQAEGLIWVFDVQEAVAADRLRLRLPGQQGFGGSVPHLAGTSVQTLRSYRTLVWTHPRKSLAFADAANPFCIVFLDLGDGELLRLGRLYPDSPCGGYGWIQTVDEFMARFAPRQLTLLD